MHIVAHHFGNQSVHQDLKTSCPSAMSEYKAVDNTQTTTKLLPLAGTFACKCVPPLNFKRPIAELMPQHKTA
eukprot:4517076-Amphidinium_carterae.1